LATFQYRAYTSQGVVTSGRIVADELAGAIEALYGSGLTPLETALVASDAPALPPAARPSLRTARVGLKELAAFTTELASLVSSGVPLDASFRVLAGAGASAKRVALANDLLKDILGGLQLSEAMARRADVFPPDYLAILAGGEAGGQTAQALLRISDMLARRLEIRNKIRAALVYPAILLLMSLASIAVIALVLIPNLAPIFADAGLPLPGVLGMLADLGETWPTIALWTVLGIAASGLIVRKLASDATAQLVIDGLKLRMPLLGRILQRREAAQFARSAGSLLEARVPLMTALQTACALIENSHARAAYRAAVGRVPEGLGLNQVLDGQDLFPPASLRLVAVGEETGQLARMLLRIAVNLEVELQGKIEQLVGLLTPLLTVGIGGLVGGLILQVMSAVLSINNLAFQ
jgi:general secretion pathway protein F